jgi:hypothetical protein
MRLALAPKVAAMEGDTVMAEADKAADDVDTVVAEEDEGAVDEVRTKGRP